MKKEIKIMDSESLIAVIVIGIVMTAVTYPMFYWL